MNVRFRWLLLLTLSWTMGACATPGSTNRGDVRFGMPAFPSRAELDALAPLELTTWDAPTGTRVERWALAGPAVEVIGATKLDTPTPLEAFVGARLTLQLTQQMRCVAREFGAHRLTHGFLPGGHVRHFILERCGATSGKVRTWVVPLNAPRSRPAAIMAGLVDGEGAAFTELREDGWGANDHVGVWEGGPSERGVAVLVAARQRARWDAFSSTVSGDEVVLQGALLEEGTGRVAGYITQGASRVRGCVVDEASVLPYFKLTCPFDPEDTTARVELVTRGNTFAMRGKQLLLQSVWREGVAPTETVETVSEATTPFAGTPEFASSFVDGVNARRGDAGYALLAYSEAQSRVLDRLFPYLATPSVPRDQRLLAGRGMLAGWDVEGPPIESVAYDIFAFESARADEVIEEIMARPYGRRMLMSPGEGALALHSTAIGDLSIVFVAVYAFATGRTHAERVEHVVDVIDQARALVGRPPTRIDRSFDPKVERLARKITSGELEPDFAAKLLAEAVGEKRRRWVSYYTLWVDRLDLAFAPGRLVALKALNAVVLVAPYQPEGHPHVSYFVTIVYLSPNTATR